MTGRALGIVVLAATLSACATSLGPQSDLHEFKRRQTIAAQTAQEDGKFRDALMLWQTVATVDPQDSDAQASISTLQSTIENETRKAISEAQAAYSRGRRSDGDRWMLRALALTPKEPTALKGLQTSVSEASHERQDKRVQSSYGEQSPEKDKTEDAPLAKAVIDPAKDIQRLFDAGDYEGVLAAVATYNDSEQERHKTVIRNSHLALAERAQKAKNPEEQLNQLDQALALGAASKSLLRERQTLAETLSDDNYRASLSLLKTDLEGAIKALEKSIAFNPRNIAAKDKLDQALTLKRNLEKIKAR